jgi:NADPH:quinone reductase
MNALAVGGRLVVIGVLGGTTTEINLAHLMVKRQQIIGSVLRARPVKEKGDIVSNFNQAVLPRLADRTIGPVIFKTFPLKDVAEAHRTMEENRHFGKIVLRMQL